jgi:AIPR protein
MLYSDQIFEELERRTTRSVTINDDIVSLDGIAIINGAQTTGSLAVAAERRAVDLDRATVMVRVIKCMIRR